MDVTPYFSNKFCLVFSFLLGSELQHLQQQYFPYPNLLPKNEVGLPHTQQFLGYVLFIKQYNLS